MKTLLILLVIFAGILLAQIAYQVISRLPYQNETHYYCFKKKQELHVFYASGRKIYKCKDEQECKEWVKKLKLE